MIETPSPKSRKIKSRHGLRIERVNSLDALGVYADAWDKLTMESPQKLPFTSYAWVSSFFQIMLDYTDSWFTLLAFDGSELVGVLPVVVKPGDLYSFYHPRLSAPHSKHAYSVDILASRGRESEIIPFLLSCLGGMEPREFFWKMTRIPENSPTLSVLTENRIAGSVVREFDGLGSILRIKGDFEKYQAGLSSNFRKNLRKANNKLGTLKDLQTVFYSKGEALDSGLEIFMQVEASGWKSLGGSAILMSPLLRDFYKKVVRRFSELGWLEWHFLQSGDKAIAAQFAVKIDRVLTIVKIGYDERYSTYSPGNFLFERVVERAFESGDTDEINCLTDMGWHDNWKMQKIDYYNIWVYPLRPIPLFLGYLPRLTRNLVRSIPGIRPIYERIKGLARGGSK